MVKGERAAAMAGLVCAMSGACAMTPMVSKKTGHVFEKSTILKFLLETQSCPITGQAMSAEDLIEVKGEWELGILCTRGRREVESAF